MIRIDGFLIDASVRDEDRMSADVTEYPVENGSAVSDLVGNRQRTLSIEGIVSDTPIGVVAAERSATTLPSDEAVKHLESVFEAGEPITVETSRKIYTDMVLESLAIPREPGTGRALAFVADFRKIRIVDLQRVRVRVAVPAAQKRRGAGNRDSKHLERLKGKRCIRWAGGIRFGTCTEYEAVFYDPNGNGGAGLYMKPDKKTPLSQEELDDWNREMELDDKANSNRPPHLTGDGKWVTDDGRIVGLAPDVGWYTDEEGISRIGERPWYYQYTPGLKDLPSGSGGTWPPPSAGGFGIIDTNTGKLPGE